MVSFKVTFDSDTRRFTLDDPCFSDVIKRIRELYGFSSFILSFQDEEKLDLCVESDIDLQEAILYFESCGDGTVRLRVVPEAKKAAPTQQPNGINFFLNGTQMVLGNMDPNLRLSDWLRNNGYTGTKVMCEQGGCGACTVMLSVYDTGSRKTVDRPVCSCLRPLASVNGCHVTTTEGIGGFRQGYHAVQNAIAKGNGSQCGFCTPGMVMSMYSLLAEHKEPTPEQVQSQFAGNLCRCTGYRPILESFQNLAADLPSREVTSTCTPLPLPATPAAGLTAALNGSEWHHAYSLQDVYTVVHAHHKTGCYLVGGHTGVGVFPDLTKDVKVSIRDVRDLAVITPHDDGVVFGAAVAIADVINTLESLVDKCPGFQNMADHLKRVAGKQVRSYGSWAGNVMLANQKPFPSDVVTVLATAGAKLTVADVTESATPVITDMPILDVVNADMTGKIILSCSILFAQGLIRTIKVMARPQNAHAFVNCGINVPVTKTKVAGGGARVIYGGVSAKPVDAIATAAALEGKDLAENASLESVLAAVVKEVVCDDSQLKRAYRQSLVPSVLYKLYLQLLPAESVSPAAVSASLPYTRGISSGKVSYPADPGNEPVGQAVPKVDAIQQAAGEALYSLDMPMPPDGLFGAFVTSKNANADIDSIDTSVAEKAVGVVRVFTAADFTEESLKIDALGYKETVLASTHVDYYGQAVGLVVADTQAHADAAASLVVVTYTKEEEPVLTLEDAIAKKSFWPVMDDPVVVGDVDKAFETAAHIIEGGIGCPTQYHFTMETQTSLAVPEEGNRMRMESSTQWPKMVQTTVSHALSMPAANVTVNVRRLGGGYGCKSRVSAPIAVAAALCADKLRRAVRIRMNLQSNMEMVGKRVPHYATYKAGTDEDGKLVAISLQIYSDSGYLPRAVGATMVAFDNVYSCPNWNVTGQACKTNLAANTSARGPGFVPGVFIIEGVMEHLAQSLGKPATEVRALNFYKKGEVTPYGYPLNWVNIDHVFSSLLASTKHDERLAAIAQFNDANAWRKRALTVVPVKYGIGWEGATFGTKVNISAADGAIQVSVSSVEMGQGLYTKVAQVVAKCLGAPFGKVTVLHTCTDMIPNGMNTGGSIGSEITCAAVQIACDTLAKRIQPFVLTAGPDATWDQIIAKCAAGGVQLFTSSWINPVDQSDFRYCSYGAAATEVEVDVLTGEAQVLKADLLWDAGVSLNPDVDIGQIEGAFVQGLGYHMTEELIIGNDGKVVSNDTWEYKPPCSYSIPLEMNTTLLANAPNPVGFMRSKATGEPSYCASAACFFAAKNAIALSRAADSNAYFAMNSPATPDHVRAVAGADVSKFFV